MKTFVDIVFSILATLTLSPVFNYLFGYFWLVVKGRQYSGRKLQKQRVQLYAKNTLIYDSTSYFTVYNDPQKATNEFDKKGLT